MEPSSNADWTSGPAKWAAVTVLGVASMGGLAWSLLRPVDRPALRAPTQPAQAPLIHADDPELPAAQPAPPPARSVKPAFTGTININTASAAELQALPGIGPALASRIVEDRSQRGPFSSVDDLDRVRGIGEKTLERLRPYLRVN